MGRRRANRVTMLKNGFEKSNCLSFFLKFLKTRINLPMGLFCLAMDSDDWKLDGGPRSVPKWFGKFGPLGATGGDLFGKKHFFRFSSKITPKTHHNQSSDKRKRPHTRTLSPHHFKQPTWDFSCCGAYRPCSCLFHSPSSYRHRSC